MKTNVISRQTLESSKYLFSAMNTNTTYKHAHTQTHMHTFRDYYIPVLVHVVRFAEAAPYLAGVKPW